MIWTGKYIASDLYKKTMAKVIIEEKHFMTDNSHFNLLPVKFLVSLRKILYALKDLKYILLARSTIWKFFSGNLDIWIGSQFNIIVFYPSILDQFLHLIQLIFIGHNVKYSI